MAAVPEAFDQDFEQAYRAHFPFLHRRSRRWLPADEAEDLVQEAFLRAWARHPGKAPEIPWLLTVIRNLAIDRSRRKSADPVGDIELLDTPHEDGPDAQVVALEERRAVRRALKNLTDSQRRALGLREWAGMTNQQIADSLGTTVPSVESLLVRGRRRLRGALEKVMAVALWPASGLWRRLRHLPEAGMAATAAPAAGAITNTVAQLATAAAVIVAGMAGGTGDGDRSAPAMRDGADTPVVSSEAERAAAMVTIRDEDDRSGRTSGATATSPSSDGQAASDEPSPPDQEDPEGEGPTLNTPKPGPGAEGPTGETPTHPSDPPAEDPEVPTVPIDSNTSGVTL